VLDRYTNYNVVYYKHKGDDENYDLTGCLHRVVTCSVRLSQQTAVTGVTGFNVLLTVHRGITYSKNQQDVLFTFDLLQ